MKNLDLNAYGVSEMNQQEMVNTDGAYYMPERGMPGSEEFYRWYDSLSKFEKFLIYF